MMTRKLIIASAIFVLAFGFAFTSISFAVHNVGPADMVLETDKHRKPAKFGHKKHQDMMECAQCHHTKTADGKKGPYVPGEEKKCVTCHNENMANDKLNDFKNAAHALCRGCHKEGYKGKKGPNKCNDCHIKK